MGKAKAVSTPVDTSVKLVKASEDTNSVDQRLYQSAVGSLLYLSTGTRPDITYAVSSVAKYFGKPINKHWIAVKRIMQHLQGFGLLYSKDGTNDCIGYSDADWGGDVDDLKSTSGYLFQISGTAGEARSRHVWLSPVKCSTGSNVVVTTHH